MKLGVCSAAYTGRNIFGRGSREAKAIAQAAEDGFESIELMVLPNMSEFPRSIQQANKQAIRGTGITPTVHSCFIDINIAALSDAIRKDSVEEMLKTLEYASFIGAEVVTVHPGRISMPIARERCMEMLNESIVRLVEGAEQVGVIICIENMEHPPANAFRTPQEFEDMFRGIRSKNLAMTLDLAHIAMNADAGVTPKDPGIWKPLFKKVKNVHISGFVRGEDHPNVSLTRSDYDYSYFYKQFLKRFEGTVILELLEKKDALESAEIVRRAVE
ncbi:MAG: sugar phosphate isomerase/epimerase [Candidatus Diapherotrites archaeon]|nr:sugar phosphate isomerase/epimerase [Candidatus Diapherotrites archaeon]